MIRQAVQHDSICPPPILGRRLIGDVPVSVPNEQTTYCMHCGHPSPRKGLAMHIPDLVKSIKSVNDITALETDPSSSPTTEYLLQALLAVLIRLLQIVFLLVEICHVRLELTTLRSKSLLHIRDWCVYEPMNHTLTLSPTYISQGGSRLTSCLHLRTLLCLWAVIPLHLLSTEAYDSLEPWRLSAALQWRVAAQRRPFSDLSPAGSSERKDPSQIQRSRSKRFQTIPSAVLRSVLTWLNVNLFSWVGIMAFG